jgi:thiol-disulfide isomerase/thioredoxin
MVVTTLFSNLDFEAASASSNAQTRVLLVDFTATWCQPCKAMERTTWRDERVVEWVVRNAIAIQVDIDTQPALATRFGVLAVPTVIALRDGVEVDRASGARPPDAFLGWLDGVLRGESELARLQRDTLPTDVNARHRLACAYAERGRFDEASREFLWLWNHAVEVEPAWIGVRHSFLANELQGLAAKHPASRAELTRLRDEAESQMEPSAPSFSDWVTLNTVLADPDRTLAWFDAHPGPIPRGERHVFHALLVEHNRWADLALLYPDATSAIADVIESRMSAEDLPSEVPDELRAGLAEHVRQSFRTSAAELYAAMRAAARDADAEAVAVEARRADGSPEMQQALEATWQKALSAR